MCVMHSTTLTITNVFPLELGLLEALHRACARKHSYLDITDADLKHFW